MPGSAHPPGLAALALAALALAGCTPYVQGNGVYYEENRTPPEIFTGIHVQNGIETTVTSGAAQQRVVVSGDANLLPYLKTQVATYAGFGSVLHLWIDVPGGTWSSTLPPRAVVDLAELRYAKTESGSHLSASGVATPLLSIDAAGNSDVFVMGAGGAQLQVVASGAVVDAGAYLVTGGALVDLSSRARAALRSNGPVTGTVGADCTLQNYGTGTCAGVAAAAGATLLCP